MQGKIIRLAFPELSTERRQEFVKIIKKMAEDGRVAVRHVRRDAMEQLKKARSRQRRDRGPGETVRKGIAEADRPIHRQD